LVTLATLNVAALGVLATNVTVATARSELVALNVAGLVSEAVKLCVLPVLENCIVCGLINRVPAFTKMSDRAL
jgi:hypothetical protein